MLRDGNGPPKSREILLFVGNQVGESCEILMFVYNRVDHTHWAGGCCTSTMSTIEHCVTTAMFVVFSETNKHQFHETQAAHLSWQSPLDALNTSASGDKPKSHALMGVLVCDRTRRGH